MENNRKDQQFNQTPNKTNSPERNKDGMSSPSRTTNKPEIDLPLKGGRSEADLSTNQPRKEGERSDSDRSDRTSR